MIFFKTFLLAIFIFFTTGCSCGEFTLPDYKADIPAENLNAYRNSDKTIIEEKMSFAPIVWFKVDNVKKVADQYSAENFTMGPLYLYSHAKNSHYDANGKLAYHSSWGSYLWDILGGYYVRRFEQNGQWIEEKHKKYLLGLFGYSNCQKYGEMMSIFFIPIPL